MRRQITVSEIVNAGIESAKNAEYHVWPGSVVSYDSSACVADIQIVVNDSRVDTTTGQRFSESWPIIPAVPIMWPRFGGFVVMGPMKAGDNVVLYGLDLDPSAWRQSGNRSDPMDTRRFSGSYWCAFPADLTVSNPGPAQSAGTAGQSMVVGSDDGTHQIVFTTSTINLGGPSPGDFVALASKVKMELTKIATALGSLTVTTGPGSGGTVVAGTPYTTPGDVASSLVKCA